MHVATQKGNLVPTAFLSIDEELVRAAEKPQKRGWYKARKHPNFSNIFPLITFLKDKNVEIQWLETPANIRGKPSVLTSY